MGKALHVPKMALAPPAEGTGGARDKSGGPAGPAGSEQGPVNNF